MKTPQYQKDLVDILLAHLDVADPAFKGSEHVRKALSEERVREYLTQWVLPTVRGLLKQQSTYQRSDAKKEAAYIRGRRESARATGAATPRLPPEFEDDDTPPWRRK